MQNEQVTETLVGTRTAIYVSLAAFLGFAFLDPWASPNAFQMLLFLRAGWCAALVVMGALTHIAWAQRHAYAMSNMACLLVGPDAWCSQASSLSTTRLTKMPSCWPFSAGRCWSLSECVMPC